MGREGEVVAELIPEFERLQPRHPRRAAADPVERGAREIAHRLRRRRDARHRPTGLELGPRAGRAGRARTDRRARRRVRQRSRAEDYFTGIWGGNVIGGRTWGVPWYADTRLLFYRSDLLRAGGLRASRRTIGPTGSRRCGRSSSAAPRATTRSSCRSTNMSRCSRSPCSSPSRCCATAAATATSARRASAARRISTSACSARGSRRAPPTRRSPTSTTSSPRGHFAFYHHRPVEHRRVQAPHAGRRARTTG